MTLTTQQHGEITMADRLSNVELLIMLSEDICGAGR